jgi:hypothetical protein
MSWKKMMIAAIVVSAGLVAPFTFKNDIAFRNLNDARAQISAQGYFCMSDRKDGHIENGFAVSREKIDWKDANHLVKVGAMGPEWRGKVWIGVIDDGLTDLYGIPDWTGTRVWGNVVALGDASLLAELEQRLKRATP